jgi:hypothetical protein
MATRDKRRVNQRKRHMLPKQKFVKRTSLEARGILTQVANALRIAEAIPQATIIILPSPTPTGILPRLLADRNHR